MSTLMDPERRAERGVECWGPPRLVQQIGISADAACLGKHLAGATGGTHLPARLHRVPLTLAHVDVVVEATGRQEYPGPDTNIHVTVAPAEAGTDDLPGTRIEFSQRCLELDPHPGTNTGLDEAAQ